MPYVAGIVLALAVSAYAMPTTSQSANAGTFMARAGNLSPGPHDG